MTEWFDLDPDEERAVAAFMSRVADLRTPSPESRLLASSELWCKAQLLRRWEAERLARRPLDIMHRIEIAGGLVAAGLLLYWSVPYLL
jgi:hypothetical protein